MKYMKHEMGLGYKKGERVSTNDVEYEEMLKFDLDFGRLPQLNRLNPAFQHFAEKLDSADWEKTGPGNQFPMRSARFLDGLTGIAPTG
jgi:hypothetical protein